MDTAAVIPDGIGHQIAQRQVRLGTEIHIHARRMADHLLEVTQLRLHLHQFPGHLRHGGRLVIADSGGGEIARVIKAAESQRQVLRRHGPGSRPVAVHGHPLPAYHGAFFRQGLRSGKDGSHQNQRPAQVP